MEWFSSSCTSVVSTLCPSSHPPPHTVPSLLPSLAMSHPCECISRSAIKFFIFHSAAENVSLCRRPQTHPMSPMSGQAITSTSRHRGSELTPTWLRRCSFSHRKLTQRTTELRLAHSRWRYLWEAPARQPFFQAVLQQALVSCGNRLHACSPPPDGSRS